MGSNVYNYNIGIIVPFYEGTQYFDQLFKSFEKSVPLFKDRVNIKMLIVDNSKTDNLEFFKTYKYKIEYIKAPVMIGYGKACNIGYRYFKKEKFDFIQIVNQDGYFDENCLERLFFSLQCKDDIMIASAIPLTLAERELEPFFIKYYLEYSSNLILDLLRKKPINECGYETVKIPGICFMFRLNGIYQEDFLFDNKIFMYFEDEDLCKRVVALNQKLVFVAGAFFYHKHSHTTDSKNIQNINIQNEISGNYLRIKYSKNKLISLYGLFIDETFDSFKQLFRGNIKYGIIKSINYFKLLRMVLRKNH